MSFQQHSYQEINGTKVELGATWNMGREMQPPFSATIECESTDPNKFGAIISLNGHHVATLGGFDDMGQAKAAARNKPYAALAELVTERMSSASD